MAPTVYFEQAGFSAFVVADVNRDGTPDLVSPQFGSSSIAVSLGDPAHPGIFLSPILILTRTKYPDSVTVADLDGDGLPDLLYGDIDDHYAGVLFQDPLHPGTFTRGDYLGPNQARPLVADLNHDGVPDIVLFPEVGEQYGAASMAVLFGDPLHRGTFLPPVTISLGIGDIITAAIADINGDGLPDVVVGEYTAQTVAVSSTIQVIPEPCLLCVIIRQARPSSISPWAT